MYSTNPGSPENLANGICIQEYYPSGSDTYYYETYSAFPSDYHVITAYSYDVTISPRTKIVYLDPHTPNNPSGTVSGKVGGWQVFRPSTSSIIQPDITTGSGTGPVVVEAESAKDILVGQIYESYNFFETYQEKFELCEVNLTAGRTYTVLITSTPYFDEFWVTVWHMFPDTDNDEWYGQGTVDFVTKKLHLTFTPEHTDTYAILIMKYQPISDSIYSMELQVYEGGYLETWIIIALSIVGFIVAVAVVRQVYKRHTIPQIKSSKLCPQCGNPLETVSNDAKGDYYHCKSCEKSFKLKN